MKTQFAETMKADDKVGGGILVDHKDGFELLTKVEAVLVGKDGKELKTIDLGHNVITYVGRSDMAHLLAGDDSANRIVNSIKCGDGGHNIADPTQALPVSASDVALFGSEIIEKLTSYDFPDGSSGSRVRFTAEVASNEGNGSGTQAYSEVGLYDLDGRMMAHKTFGLITKSDAFGIIWRWTIIL